MSYGASPGAVTLWMGVGITVIVYAGWGWVGLLCLGALFVLAVIGFIIAACLFVALDKSER